MLGWLDIKGRPSAADPSGEHWACLIRPRGEPAWIKLPGSGANGVWTQDDEELPARVRNMLANRPQDAAAEWQPLARLLAAQRLVPVEGVLRADGAGPAVQHLIILPSPALAGIPIETLTDRYTISYAPSGTMFAWLQAQQQSAPSEDSGSRRSSLLALGDPVFEQPASPASPDPELPAQGLVLAQVLPGGNAARGGLRAGDVLLNYAGTTLSGVADLKTALAKSANQSQTDITAQFWRDSQIRVATLKPGPLGVVPSAQLPAQAIRAQREGNQLVRSATAQTFPLLPGTRREVTAIARLFAEKKILLGSEASEQNLDALAAADRLRDFRFVHLATHGLLNEQIALHSALILARDPLADPIERTLAGKTVYDGKLTA